MKKRRLSAKKIKEIQSCNVRISILRSEIVTSALDPRGWVWKK